MEKKLGEGQNRAFIYTRDGRTDLGLELPLTSIEWSRGLCEVTRAVVTVTSADCSPGLAKVHPWAHSLVVFRNGARVWEGPVRRRTDSRAGVTLTASDVLGWTERRAIAAARQILAARVVTEMGWTITEAFTRDDPNVLPYLQTLGAELGATLDRDVAVASGYHADDLGTLVGAGGRWTALGRSILLWDRTHVIGSLPDLSPEDHLLADVDVTEDGDGLATTVTARNDDGLVQTYDDGAPLDDFYGQVELLVGAEAKNPAGVLAYATTARAGAYPQPYTIDVPSDAALRCDAPFPIERLVPGVVVPVQTTTATSLTIRGSFILSGVTVSQAARENERVAITLIPVDGDLS